MKREQKKNLKGTYIKVSRRFLLAFSVWVCVCSSSTHRLEEFIFQCNFFLPSTRFPYYCHILTFFWELSSGSFFSYENVIVGFQTVITALNLDIKHMLVIRRLNKSKIVEKESNMPNTADNNNKKKTIGLHTSDHK